MRLLHWLNDLEAKMENFPLHISHKTTNTKRWYLKRGKEKFRIFHLVLKSSRSTGPVLQDSSSQDFLTFKILVLLMVQISGVQQLSFGRFIPFTWGFYFHLLVLHTHRLQQAKPRDRSIPPRNWVSFTFTAILFLGVSKAGVFHWYLVS